MKRIKQNTNAELLKWIWSYNEQLILLDRHDAYWIDQARLGWEDKYAFKSFLSTYGLFRGKAGKFLSAHKQKFINVCNKYFSQPLTKGDFTTAQEIWKNAVSELKGKKYNTDDVLLWSATLKAFWFYHPDKLPMYDRYARDALECLRKNKIFIISDDILSPKRTVQPENFLIVFSEFYTQVALAQIKEVEEYMHRSYKYKYRIADKFLWLNGSGADSQIITTFKRGLVMAPQNVSRKLNV